MKIIVSGGSGLVGKALIQRLTSEHHEIINLTTSPKKIGRHGNVEHVFWNPAAEDIPAHIFTDCDAVINLAGFNIANRWSKHNQQEMMDSRILSTRLLVQKVNNHCLKNITFISTSASGFYLASRELMDETKPKGNDFLAELSDAWEKELLPLSPEKCRLVVLRVSVVLDAHDGAVGKMLPFFKLGLGSAVGHGKQLMAWIHIHDLVNMYHFALHNPINGVFNATADQACSNYDYSKALAKAIRKPFFLPAIPSFMLYLLFGKMAIMLLQDRNLSNVKIKQAGFTFAHSQINSALVSLFPHETKN
jgi:uncharacterized protein (TIGR01777 family)